MYQAIKKGEIKLKKKKKVSWKKKGTRKGEEEVNWNLALIKFGII